MDAFIYIGFYFIPVFGYLFILFLLRAIQCIVRNRPYTTELFWSGLMFSFIVTMIFIAAGSTT